MKIKNFIKHFLSVTALLFAFVNPAFADISFPFNGGSTQTTFSSAGQWDILSSPSWVSISPDQGSGGGTVTITITCSANSSTNSRNGIILIGTEGSISIPVSQAGAPSTDISFGYTGGSTETAFTSTGQWDVLSNPSWVSISPDQGPGGGIVTITITCSANPDAIARNGIILIGTEGSISIDVSQAAAPPRWNSTTNGIYVDDNVNVGIGVESPGYPLDVNGTIHTSEVLVDQVFTQPDYVFEDGYLLKSLTEVEQFIKENKHLPDIPSAEEVEANGIDLGEIHTKLLLKIEELTLYAIELQKKNEMLLDLFNKHECKSNQGETKNEN